MDSEWPVYTGTRTHVAETARSGIPRIFLLSSRSLCSSLVSSAPSSTKVPAKGSTLKATGPAKTVGAGNSESSAEPSKVSSAARSPTLRTCSSSSCTPAPPAPETAW